MVTIRDLSVLAVFTFPIHTEALNNMTSLYDKIPQLRALANVSAPATSVNSRFNSTYCCLQTMRDGIAHGPDTRTNGIFNGGYLLLDNESEFYSVNHTEISLGYDNVTRFIEVTQEEGGFPCSSTGESDAHAPSLTITARYCLDTCGRGWQRSQTSDTAQWISPFFGFIIPAVVFCLSIPRRRKLEIPDALFRARLDDIFAWLFAIPKLIIAALLVGSDTLVWLCVCFAYSGPMLLSAVYEAWLDNRLVYFFDAQESTHLTAQMTALLLFVVLVGNLDLDVHSNEVEHRELQENVPVITGIAIGPIVTQETFQRNSNCESTATDTRMLADARLHPHMSGYGNSFIERLGHVRDTAMSPDEERSVGSTTGRMSIVGEGNLVPFEPEYRAQEIISDLRSTLEQSSKNAIDELSIPNPKFDIDAKLGELQDLVRDLRKQALDADARETDEPGFLKAQTASPLSHIEQLIYDLRLYGTQGHCDTEESGSEYAKTHSCYHTCQWKPANHKTSKASETPRYKQCLARVQTRLRTMLACQSSFGSAVGSPVVFFVGAFVFTLATELIDLGDKGTALNLSFGMWWMIIPHIAIISGLLLAGNNPNTLEGVVAHETLREEDPLTLYAIVSETFIHFGLLSREWFETKRANGKPKRFVSFLKSPIFNWVGIQLAYPSRYKTQWLWQRGANKRHWINAVINNYLISKVEIPRRFRVDEEKLEAEELQLTTNEKHRVDPTILALRKRMSFSFGDWVQVFFLASFLLLVPFGLSFMTSYETPTIGLSCRSLTFTVYLITQILQMVISFYDWQAGLRETKVYWRHIRYILSIFLGLVAVLSAIGGTMMQLGGVYNNCVCDVPIRYWFDLNNPKATLEIGTNSVREIHQASKYWVPGAGTAVGFLSVVCYIGWWYQRRLRNKFRRIVGDLHKENKVRVM